MFIDMYENKVLVGWSIYELNIVVSSLVFDLQSFNGQENWYIFFT